MVDNSVENRQGFPSPSQVQVYNGIPAAVCSVSLSGIFLHNKCEVVLVLKVKENRELSREIWDRFVSTIEPCVHRAQNAALCSLKEVKFL